MLDSASKVHHPRATGEQDISQDSSVRDRNSEHPLEKSAAKRSRTKLSWRLLYMAGLFVVAAVAFLLAADGGRLALLVLFGGLMALHHIPGGHHGSHPSHTGAPEDKRERP